MEMEWKLEPETGTGNWKLKTEMEMQPLSCCSPSKTQLLLVFVPRHSQCSPHLHFLIGCFASLASFPGLCHPQYLWNGAIVSRCLCKIGPGYEAIICFTYCKQSKLEVCLGTRLHARIGMLALFQNEVGYSCGQIVTSLVPRSSHT